MGLPCCSEQCARDVAPQLGAGDTFGVGEERALSDKKLKAMVDDPVEHGLGSGGGAAILL